MRGWRFATIQIADYGFGTIIESLYFLISVFSLSLQKLGNQEKGSIWIKLAFLDICRLENVLPSAAQKGR